MSLTAADDELDAVLNLESSFYEEGVADSRNAGANAGHNDGRGLGWAAGSSMASELAFYRGSVYTLLSLAETFPDRVPTRALTTARTLQTVVESVPLHFVGNDANVDMEAHVEQVRNLFRTTMAQAGLLVRYDRRPTRIADLSF